MLIEKLRTVDYSTDINSILKEMRRILKPFANPKTLHFPPSPIVLIGGGSGTPTVGRSLIQIGIKNFSLIANVFDTLRDKKTRKAVGVGILKEKFNIPDLVDIVKQLLHTSPENEKTELHKFLDEKPKEAMRLGYLFLAALFQLGGNLQKAIDIASTLLENSFRVLAPTETVTEAFYEKKGKLFDLYTFASKNYSLPERIILKPPAKITPLVQKLIKKACYLIFGPGDVHFSVLPHFSLDGFSETVVESRAKIILITNLTAREIDIPGFKLTDFLNLYSCYLPTDRDVITLVHRGSYDFDNPLVDNVRGERYRRFRLLRDDLTSGKLDNNLQLLHDETKLGRVLSKILT